MGMVSLTKATFHLNLVGRFAWIIALVKVLGIDLGEGRCFPRSVLFNGYRSPDFPVNIYLKLPKNVETSESSIIQESEPICESSQAEAMVGSLDKYNKTGGMKYIYFYWFVSAVGLIEAFFIATDWCFLSRGHGVPMSVEEGYQAISNEFRRFEEIDRGGSGSVYKDVLDDKESGSSEEIGRCKTPPNLPHEFSENVGILWKMVSLDKHLFSNSSSSGQYAINILRMQ